MFAPSTSEDQTCHIERDENAQKQKGLLVSSLRKVLEQVHPSMSAREEALEYVENLILRLLEVLCANPKPHSIQDVDERVQQTFPTPIDRWALKEAKEIMEHSHKKSHMQLVLPVDKVHHLLCKEVLNYKVDFQVTLFIAAVLEYVSADILKLAGNYVKNICYSEITSEITCQDIRVAMCADKVLMDMFCQDDSTLAIAEVAAVESHTSHSYEEVVKDLISDQKQHLRDLHMIIKVFREELLRVIPPNDKLDSMFCNISDIHELTVTLLGLVEDMLEMSEEGQVATIGSCFEELAEGAEFDVYSKYAKDIQGGCNEALSSLISKPDLYNALQSAGHGFREAVKYYLPKLLLAPVWHCFLYFDYIKDLRKLTPAEEDKESLEQVESLLSPLQMDLNKIMTNVPKKEVVRTPVRAKQQEALKKTGELQRTIEGWESKELSQYCSEFIREDFLCKLSSNGRHLTKRKVFLFDGVMLLCKPIKKRPAISVTAQYSSCIPGEYRLKEKFYTRKIEITDREDTEELKHAFEIAPRVQPSVILIAKSSEDKNSWMADLVMLNTKSMLERILDSILLDEKKKHPLLLPSPSVYRFSEADSNANIVLEERENLGVPLIKGATLCKLIERLTYHVYADPVFVRTFLITYRSFCTPQEFLSFLIQRFNIPDPCVLNKELKDLEKASTSIQRKDWKCYQKEFCQPIQIRVLNVLRHWVDHHYYDFEQDTSLLEKLHNFLNSINGKSMRKWVDCVYKSTQRKKEQIKQQREITFGYDRSPPSIEWHICTPEEDWNILTLHPVEIARQLTLLEFDLYRAVKPSELVGAVWTKQGKQQTSPNLLALIKHSTKLTLWLEKNIVEVENYEERVAIVSRIIEIMIVLHELNNFNGVMTVISAMASAPVFRLKFTFQGISARLEKALEEAKELNNNHFKKYQEKLRSINPPCVPFFGIYLTNILMTEEANLDYLPSSPKLINFSKRRMVAEIVAEIQQYQNQPYCLSVEPRIRLFLESLDPFKGMEYNEVSTLLYNKSLELEPRDCKQAPKFPRKWPYLNLKSPGIKNRNLIRSHLPQPLSNIVTSRSPHHPHNDRTCTPPSASHTPPLQGLADFSIFKLNKNNLQEGSFNSNLSPSAAPVNLLSTTSVSPSSPAPTTSSQPPPPLPPRSLHWEKAPQQTDAPMLPQRNLSPPPLPPRPSSGRQSSTLDHASTIPATQHLPFNAPHYSTAMPQNEHAKSASVPMSMVQPRWQPSSSSVGLTARVTGPPVSYTPSNIPRLPTKPSKSNIMFQFNINEK